MKKSIILLIIGLISIPAIVLAVKLKKSNQSQDNQEFLRIHIRANSNADSDQNVKYKVKEKVVEFLTPILASCSTKDQAKSAIAANLASICSVANTTLKDNGFSYTARAKICKENFPTRSYGSLTLKQGEYDALILELGTGTGDNWWCVMFPPLCFVGSQQNNKNYVVYKSKLWEIIKKYC